jgi:release factor glutamine methyltransferase
MNGDEIGLKGLDLAGALHKISSLLSPRALDDAESESRMLLLGAAGLTRLDLILNPERVLANDAAETLEAFVARRLAGEPATRILGARAFWTLDLRVTPDVLDPRPDSETIVIAALEAIGTRKGEALRILDLGTGSGALLLAMLSECPQATGVGVDLSGEACAIARENAVKNGLAGRADIVQGCWTDGLTETFDVVVSNPPYIETAVIADLAREVRQHDPMLALDGGEDGLTAYRKIAQALSAILRPDGVAVLELGIGQGPAVAGLAEAAGLSVRGFRADLGGIQRALVLGPGKQT